MNKHTLLFSSFLIGSSIILGACCQPDKINIRENSPTESITSAIMNSDNDIQISEGDWENYLYTPTQIIKALGYYFIQDCWNGRILYSSSLSNNLSDWNTLTDDFKGGHSLATDGRVIIADNSNNDQVYVYMYDHEKNIFVNSQIISVENRPHYVLYDEKSELFYVLSSYSGIITELKVNETGEVSVVDTIHLDEPIEYARSMSVIDDYLYIPDASGTIYKIDYLHNFETCDMFKVSDNIGGMNYLCKIDNYYYLSVYTGKDFDMNYSSRLIRSTSIENISDGRYEDITNLFGFSGTPYFISSFDNKYFITEIDNANSICSFETDGSSITNISYLFRYDTVSASSIERKQSVLE